METILNPTYYLPITIPEKIRKLADNFATQQLKPEHREKVFLNTLAVYAVHTYLKHGDIETDLNKSSSWHPLDRALFDVSDLYIPHLEVSIECCSVKPNEEMVNFTANSLDKNIMGYVAVQFLDTFEEIRLIGYLSAHKVDDNYSELPLPLTKFEHTSDIFDDLFILDESKIMWQEELKNIQDEKLKSFLESLFTDENEGEITKSILDYVKNPEYKWYRQQAKNALERFNLQQELQQELEKRQTAEDALEKFREENQQSRQQVEDALNKLNLEPQSLSRKNSLLQIKKLETDGDFMKKVEQWFQSIQESINEVLEY